LLIFVFTDYERVRDWTINSPGAFARPGVFLNQTTAQIHIRQAGVYLVSSRLAFRAPSVNNKPVRFGQRIHLNDLVDPLFEDSQVKTCLEEGLTCFTTQLFHVVYLDSGSTLSVYAKPSYLLSSNQRSSFIDVIWIG